MNMTDEEILQPEQWGASAVTHPEYVAEQKRKTEELRSMLTQPEQEPVAYLCENAVGHKYFRWKKPSSTYKPIALYTTPPQRTCEGCGKVAKP